MNKYILSVLIISSIQSNAAVNPSCVDRKLNAINTKLSTVEATSRLRIEAEVLRSEGLPSEAKFRDAAAAMIQKEQIKIDPDIKIADVTKGSAYTTQLQQYSGLSQVEKANAFEVMVASNDVRYYPQAALIKEANIQNDMKLPSGAWRSEFSSPSARAEYATDRWRATLSELNPTQRSLVLAQVQRIWPGFR